MKVYDTKSMTEKYRTSQYNGLGEFTECEHCGYKNEARNSVCITYYDKYKKILCDRCVDNFDGVTPWSDKFAAQHGLPPYPVNLKELF